MHLKLILCALTALLSQPQLPEGWLLWHSYTAYEALDSTLYLRSPEGQITEISGNFIHAMNGSFGTVPQDIVFMAIDPAQDEWDIYLYRSGSITNLTENSGFRNEDPKFSPDGSTIVFKRGFWNAEAGDFQYDLALLDPKTGAVTMLTNDRMEEAMPCFSRDGRSVYYAGYTDGLGAIWRMDPADGSTELVFQEPQSCAYYPIAGEDALYFTKWRSPESREDTIFRFAEDVTEMPFAAPGCNCSDPCPVGKAGMIYSCTKNGSYDLCYFNGTDSVSLDFAGTSRQELGAAFFPLPCPGDVDGDGSCTAADAAMLQRFLLGSGTLTCPAAADLNEDGVTDVFDLGLLKRRLRAEPPQ